MVKGPKLTPSQWKLLASVFANIGQAIIIFGLAAIFVPQVVNLPKDFSHPLGVAYLLCGFATIGVGVIMAKREK